MEPARCGSAVWGASRVGIRTGAGVGGLDWRGGGGLPPTYTESQDREASSENLVLQGVGTVSVGGGRGYKTPKIFSQNPY